MCICVYVRRVVSHIIYTSTYSIASHIIENGYRNTAIPLGISACLVDDFSTDIHCSFASLYFMFVYRSFCVAFQFNSSLVSFRCDFFIVCLALLTALKVRHTHTNIRTCDQHAPLRCLFILWFRMCHAIININLYFMCCPHELLDWNGVNK